jgi:hypothetical protein
MTILFWGDDNTQSKVSNLSFNCNPKTQVHNSTANLDHPPTNCDFCVVNSYELMVAA